MKNSRQEEYFSTIVEKYWKYSINNITFYAFKRRYYKTLFYNILLEFNNIFAVILSIFLFIISKIFTFVKIICNHISLSNNFKDNSMGSQIDY